MTHHRSPGLFESAFRPCGRRITQQFHQRSVPRATAALFIRPRIVEEISASESASRTRGRAPIACTKRARWSCSLRRVGQNTEPHPVHPRSLKSGLTGSSRVHPPSAVLHYSTAERDHTLLALRIEMNVRFDGTESRSLILPEVGAWQSYNGVKGAPVCVSDRANSIVSAIVVSDSRETRE